MSLFFTLLKVSTVSRTNCQSAAAGSSRAWRFRLLTICRSASTNLKTHKKNVNKQLTACKQNKGRRKNNTNKVLFDWSHNSSHLTMYPYVLKIKTIIVVKQKFAKMQFVYYLQIYKSISCYSAAWTSWEQGRQIMDL